MKRNLCALIVLVFMLSGCDATMVMGGKVMGVSSGRFIYQDGYLSTQYKANVDQVWLAGEKTVTDLKGSKIEKDRKIAGGSIRAVISDEKVTILVEYVEKDVTNVSVMCGIGGSNIASRMIQDKIAANIVKP
jgi:glucose-6-phosphate isomerase